MLEMYSKQEFIDIIKNRTDWNSTTLSPIRKDIAQVLFESFDGKCFFCRRVISRDDVTLEHIVCRKKYSIFTYNCKNLAVACEECNSLKRTDDVFAPNINTSELISYEDYPFKSEDYCIIHPYLDEYDRYITISEIFYISNGNKGKKTIELYHLDRLNLAEEKIKKREKKLELLRILNEENSNQTELINRLIDDRINICNINFNRYIDKKTKGKSPFSNETIRKILNINKNHLKDFIIVKRNLDNNTINELEDKMIIENSLYLLGVLLEVIKYSTDRNDLMVLSTTDTSDFEVSFKNYKDTNGNLQISFALKFIYILQILRDFNIKEESDTLLIKLKKIVNELEKKIS